MKGSEKVQKKVLLLTFCSSLLLLICSCSDKSIKNENNAAFSDNMIVMENNNTVLKDQTSPTSYMDGIISNNDFIKIRQKTAELENSIKEMPTILEQLKLSFHKLDGKDAYGSYNNYDMVEFQNFTMSIFKDFLKSEESYSMPASDYYKLSEAINVFSLKNGTVFTYCGSSLLFGDSGKTSFAFFQTRIDDEIKVLLLYENVFRDVLDVIQHTEDENIIIIAGRSRNGKPWKAFVDGFYISNDTVSNIEILENYNDGFWCIDPIEDTIFLLDSSTAETYISKISDQSIEIAAGDVKINLSFNIKNLKYSVQKE